MIVLFHRIDDELLNNPITCTTAEFNEFITFFTKYFEVVPLSEFLDRLEAGEGVGGCLAITFDDGYLDNAHIAAPILADRRLPATFFIATDFIGSDRIPWWDAERGIRSRWMSWDDVRKLRKMGFEIGAHTKNHVDLGVIHGPEAKLEIEGSMRRLEAELGETITLFSYPYGRADQMSDDNRQLVRDLGLRCSPSAFGGHVDNGDSSYKLRRQPISSWHVNPWQFGFEHLLACIHSGRRDNRNEVS